MNKTAPARTHRALGLLSLLVVAGLGLAACGGDDSSPTIPAPAPTPAPTPPAPEPEPEVPEEATYTIQYQPIYSSDPFFQALGAAPYPEGIEGTAPPVAFVSMPVGGVMWEENGIASDGLKTLAETGDSSEALAEAEAMGYTVLASSFAEITAVLGAGQVTLNVAQPCLSYAQMVVPSPDWFVGFNVCAVGDDGQWLEEIAVAGWAYDAGTAEGEEFAFKAEGADTDPREPIVRLLKPPFDADPVSRITATLQQE